MGHFHSRAQVLGTVPQRSVRCFAILDAANARSVRPFVRGTDGGETMRSSFRAVVSGLRSVGYTEVCLEQSQDIVALALIINEDVQSYSA